MELWNTPFSYCTVQSLMFSIYLRSQGDRKEIALHGVQVYELSELTVTLQVLVPSGPNFNRCILFRS